MQLPEKILCGYFDCSSFGNLTQSKTRTCELYEIEFYLENAKTTTLNGTTYDIRKNHILIATPGQKRHSKLPFKTMYLKFPARGSIAGILNQMPHYFYCSHPEKIYDTINEMVKYQERKNQLLVYSNFLALLNVLVTDSTATVDRNNKNYAVVSSAKQYIQKHYNEPIQLQDIAQSVFLSKTYFQSIFVSVCGKTPHQYLIEKRIENAKIYLRNTNLSMLEVAEKTGFTCQQHFNRMFKAATGTSPLAYKKMCSNKYFQS